MKTADRELKSDQLMLFERRPLRTSWESLPLNIRQEIVRIMAKMLIEHRTRRCRLASRGGENQ